MTDETTKSRLRRLSDDRFVNRYFVGDGIDIGCGSDPLSKHTNIYTNIKSVKPWDLQDGDAQYMHGVADNTFDFVHSSHCLEHIEIIKIELIDHKFKYGIGRVDQTDGGDSESAIEFIIKKQ